MTKSNEKIIAFLSALMEQMSKKWDGKGQTYLDIKFENTFKPYRYGALDKIKKVDFEKVVRLGVLSTNKSDMNDFVLIKNEDNSWDDILK